MFVFFGGPNGITASANTRLQPPGIGPQFFGSSVAGVGDVNGDGFADVVVGAPGNPANGDMGEVYLYLGNSMRTSSSSSTPIFYSSAAAGDRFGSAISGIGDTNRDGFCDFAVGAPGVTDTNGSTGGLDVFFGGPNGPVQHGTNLPPIITQHAGSTRGRGWHGSEQRRVS